MRTSIPAAVLATVIAVVSLTACSPQTDAGGDSETPGASSACLETVTPIVEAAKNPIPLQLPDAPLDLEAAEGDTIALVSIVLNNTYTNAIKDGIEAAADAAGASVDVFDAQGSVNQAAAGIDQAIARGVDGIVLVSVEHALVAPSLEAAAAADIPVVTLTGGTLGEDLPVGVTATITADYTEMGRVGAAWAAVESNCAADVALVTTSLIGVFTAAAESAQASLEEFCPETCTSTVLDVDLANAATDIPGQVTTALQRDPGITQVYAMWDGAVGLLTPAVASSGSSAQIMGMDGIDESIAAIAEDSGQDVTIAVSPPAWQGWAAFDDIERSLQGLPLVDYVSNTRLIDSTNIGDGGLAAVMPEHVGFEKAFVAAWNGQ